MEVLIPRHILSNLIKMTLQLKHGQIVTWIYQLMQISFQMGRTGWFRPFLALI
jgi:hypothetical protein